MEKKFALAKKEQMFYNDNIIICRQCQELKEENSMKGI